MKLLTCPLNGERPLQEFQYGGQYRHAPEPGCSDAIWAEYVFNRAGAPGVRIEWWYHLPSGTWFLAERDTLRDEFIRTGFYEEFFGHE
jgi:sarcosine oxidase subunit delta